MTKKLITLLLALTMVFACAVPSFALSDLNSSDTQDALSAATASPSSMTVYLSVQSDRINGYYINRGYYTVNMTSSDYSRSDGVCVVGDVLRKAATTYSWLNFFDSSYNVLPNGPTGYVFAISDTSVNYGSTIFDASTSASTRLGWMYRVNRKYQLLDSSDYPEGYDVSTSGPCGAALETTIVESGDKIDLYYADAYSSSSCTKKTYIEPVYKSGKYGIRVYASYIWFDTHANGDFLYIDTTSKTATIHQYALVKNTSFSVTVDGTTTTYTTDSSGIFYPSGLTSGSGSHTIKLLPKFGNSKQVNGVTCYMPSYTGMSVTFTL